MLHWAFRLSLFTALLLMGFAAWSAWRADSPLVESEEISSAQGLFVECPDYDLGSVPVGENFINIVLTNNSATEHRLVGIHGGCTWMCCLSTVDDVPIAIGPHQTHTIRFRVIVNNHGPFGSDMTFFVDNAGVRPLPVSVRGVGIVSP